MRTGRQEDGPMLQQRPALFSLGAADHLGGVHNQIARSEMLKTEQTSGALFLGHSGGRNTQTRQRLSDNRVHPAQPRLVSMIDQTGRQAQRVGQLMMVHQSLASRRPADKRQLRQPLIASANTV